MLAVRVSNSRSRMCAWLARYGPAELAGSLTAVSTLVAVNGASGNTTLAAYAVAIAENLVYYGVIFMRDLVADRPTHEAATRALSRGTTVLRRMVLEFGGAEALDVLVVRPFCLACGISLGGSLGALAGKLVADLAFYGPVVAMREWLTGRRRGALAPGRRSAATANQTSTSIG
jgi:hypothetical protein